MVSFSESIAERAKRAERVAMALETASIAYEYLECLTLNDRHTHIQNNLTEFGSFVLFQTPTRMDIVHTSKCDIAIIFILSVRLIYKHTD